LRLIRRRQRAGACLRRRTGLSCDHHMKTPKLPASLPALRGFPMRLSFFRVLLPVAGVLALSSCASAPLAFEPLDGSISGTCHVDMVRGAVGLSASQPTLERIRVDSDSLQVLETDGPLDAAESGGDTVMVQVGEQNRIGDIRCAQSV
jgi:hypothetical protein